MLKVLIAYDGSECSEKALWDLRKAGMPEKAEAVVLTVADAWIDKGGVLIDSAMGSQYAALINTELESMRASLKEARNTAQRAAERLKVLFPHWQVRAESAANPPMWGVIEKIESWKPDFVVMGSHGRSAAGRLFFGSVSHGVLSHVHCNLRISRGRDEKEKEIPPLRIVVAFDGSQESETAFQSALRRHWPKGTAIRLLTVEDIRVSTAFINPTGPIRYWMREADKNPLAWVERMLTDQKKHIEERGLIAYADILKGDPKRALLKEAEAWGADTIFVGPRGLTGSQRIIAGSVSTALATHAHCSVEIVHRLWDAAVCCDKVHGEHRECMARNIDLA